MHFRFLGGQDCPDWLLAQISDFSKLSSVKFKGLCQLSIDFLLNKKVADDDVRRFVSEHTEISYVRRFLYSISFMMRNAASYNCPRELFESECTHLGLPAEHSKMLSRVYTVNLDALNKYVMDSIPKDPPLEFVLITEETESNPTLRYIKGRKATVCTLTHGQLSSLRHDMLLIREMIKQNVED